MSISAESGAPTAYTPQQFAALAQLHVTTVMRHIHDGTLPAFRIGRAWRIRAEVVEAVMNGEL